MRNSCLVAAVLLCLILCQMSPAVDESDAVLGLSYHDTSMDELYDYGLMGDVMIRGWYENGLGFGVAVGAGGYRADARTSSLASGIVTAAKSSGYVLTFPLGVSALYQIPAGEDAILSFDAGFRYVLVEPNADLRANRAGAGPIDHKIDIDHGWTGVLGLNFEKRISEKVSWLVGGGYQFDIDKGKAEWMGIDIGDNELESVFLRIGLVFRE